MTRATLLHVLDQPTALGPAEVRELEQLAQAFPYCQTAHLLLAKAAHDQGTMLAGQRLRRAATYAADRTLLRRLIEQVEPAVQPLLPAAPANETSAPEPVAAATVLAPETTYVVPTSPPPEPVAQVEAAAAGQPAQVAELALLPGPAAPAMSIPERPVATAEPETEVAAETPLAVACADLEAAEAGVEPGADVPATAPEAAEPTAVAAPHILAVQAEPTPELLPWVLPAVADLPGAAPEPELELPPQAPAIRPPVEVGEARFEFGLADPPTPAAPAYELPGLVDEWAASAVTRSLGTPESLPDLLAVPLAPLAAAKPILTPAAFTGDAAVGYSFGESSRLGFSLQLLNLLTDEAEPDGTLLSLEAAAQPLAASLPPAGTFFEPDPLLLDHWQQHAPPAVLLPSSLDLINNFLRRQPRLTRPAMLPPSPASQTDLSVRSTRVEPDLVSESLARILVRQGKTARAIEVYEKLLVKQPEKAAYFTAQIQQLRPADNPGY